MRHEDVRSVYRKATGQSAGPLRHVVMLYEQLIHDLQRAIAAIARNDIETRTAELNHALQVVGHLQGTIDVKAGGNVATNLEHFYNVLRGSLLTAQIKASTAILQQQMASLMDLREAWIQVEQSQAREVQPAAAQATETTDERPVQWNG